MIHRLLVLASLVCCALVVASFALFARDQVAGASKHQVSELSSGVAPAPVSKPAQHGQPRAFIDGAASALTAPFRSFVQSDSQWVAHGLPAILAVLAYGVGLGFVARYSRGVS